MRNIIHDTAFGQCHQYVVDLLACQPGTYGQGCFADISIIREHSCVRTEDGLYQCFRFRSHFAQLVQFIPAEREQDTRSIVLLVRIFQITGLGQYFQCTVHRNRKIFEFPAELFDIEFADTLESVSHRHLIVILQMFVDIEYVFLVGKCIRYPLM